MMLKIRFFQLFLLDASAEAIAQIIEGIERYLNPENPRGNQQILR